MCNLYVYRLGGAFASCVSVLWLLRCVQLLEVFMMIFRPSNSAAGGPTYMYLDRYRLTGHCTYPLHSWFMLIADADPL